MERLSKIDKTFDSPSIISDLLKCSYNVNIYSEGWILKSFVRFNWIGLANVIVLYKIRSRLNHILWWFCVGHFWTKSPQTHTHISNIKWIYPRNWLRCPFLLNKNTKPRNFVLHFSTQNSFACLFHNKSCAICCCLLDYFQLNMTKGYQGVE